MCRIDHLDSSGLWLKEPKPVVARKEHKCGDCGRTIAKGETYTTGTWIEEGEYLDTVKQCERCAAAGRWITVVCGGFVFDAVCEELREHWDDEWQLRSHGLGRLVLAAENQWERHGELLPVSTVAAWAEAGIAKYRRDLARVGGTGEAE